ncbi:hypothetical protein [Leptolyngbya sp. FACHB-17]|uniref:hypothetical protein n=1 Tax=unclassified Leptolyngbya TaxID=2650499 RepID=UPI001680A695|nr:hypothetical protein [Leptolyngbya sp. FACHB-17]MBD2078601.1 hypothetical protein [Leptolyngbya sp. FACHB-17]
MMKPSTQIDAFQAFHSIPMLSESECQTIRSVIYELKQDWTRRNPFLPSYTLGAASYLDAAENEQYLQSAQRSNPLLSSRFAGLYQRLGTVLAQHLGAPINYNHSFALPGFHIYLSCVLFEFPIASIHIDLQYQQLQWDAEDTDFTNPISFTLPISLPQSGGGLNVWNVEQSEMPDSASLQQLIQSREQRFYPYEIGSLVVHSGSTLHQAAPGSNLKPDDDRITLQGHGLFSRGCWQLYW